MLAIGVTALVAAFVSVPVLAGDAPTPTGADSSLHPAATPREAQPLSTAESPAIVEVLPAGNHASLAALTAATAHRDPDDAELHCLATGVYFESRGEPLEGQLAVAQVILNRASSGRFASTACGVLTQRSQFSFVRGGAIPLAPQQSSDWRTAVAIARIARANVWQSPAPGALFFHARRVSPGWTRPVVARLGNHIFYR